MKLKKLWVSFILSSLSTTLWAVPEVIQCPAPTDFYHSAGLPWELVNAAHKWAVMSIANESYLSTIPQNTVVKVAIDEEMDGHLTATCAYVLPAIPPNQAQNEVIVKSLFEVAVTADPSEFKNFKRDAKHPSELICRTTSNALDKCIWSAYS